MYAASAADVVTTEWALRRPGGYERNPFMGDRSVRLAAHAAVPAVAWWTTEWLQRNRSRKAALFLRIGITAGYTFLAVHNARVARGS